MKRGSVMCKRYYDPEYHRIVDEQVIKNQFNWFSKQSWFHKNYETFKKENFLNENMTEIEE